MENKIIFYCGKVDSQGGSKVSLLNNLKMISKKEIPYQIYVGNTGWFTEELTKHGLNYELLKEPKKIYHSNNKESIFKLLLYLFLSTPILLLNWIKVLKNHKGKKTTIVFNESRDIILFFPFLFKRKSRIIHWARSEHIKFFSKSIMNRSDLVVAVSKQVKENINMEINTEITVLHNFIAGEIESNPRSNLSNRISVAGSIQPIKGQLDAVRSMAKLQNELISLEIIGRVIDDEYEKTIKKEIELNGLENKVTFIEHQTNLVDYIDENSDIVIMPSQTESFGRVAMEAMSKGIPVIAYPSGGLKEVVNNGVTGILTREKNIKSLVNSIKIVLNDSKVYEEMSVNSIREFKNKFSEKAIEQKLTEILVGENK